MTTAPRTALALVLGLGLGSVRASHAGPCDARLTRIAETLDADAHAGRIHAWSWGLGNGAIAVGLVGLALASSDPGARAEAYVGAGGSLVAAAFPLWLQRLPAIDDAPRLDRALAATSDPGARCELLVDAERLLARSARDERSARGLWSHALNVGINAGGWVLVGVGWHRWRTSGVGALVSIGLGELQIYTRPSGAMRVEPVISAGQTGVQVGGVF